MKLKRRERTPKPIKDMNAAQLMEEALEGKTHRGRRLAWLLQNTPDAYGDGFALHYFRDEHGDRGGMRGDKR